MLRTAANLREGVVVEPQRHIPVREEVDVLVAGGGLAGVSAAVAAARAGARTLLVERNSYPGGVATAGMCCSVFNAYYTATHELVVKGNSLQFVDELAKAEGPGSEWHNHKGHIIYDVERAKLVLTDLLERAGSRYLLGTLVTNVIMDGEAVSGVIIESKSGREALRAKVVVDATGDADIAQLSGAPMRGFGDDGGGLHSLVFRMGNVDVDAFVDYFAQNPDQYPPYMDVDWQFEEAQEQYRKTGTFLFPHGGGEQMRLIQEGVASGEYPEQVGVHTQIDALQMHAIRDLGVVHLITGFCRFGDPDIDKITRGIADGRKMAFEVADYFRKHVPGFERCFVNATGDNLGIRVTRWIDGEFVFTPEMKGEPTRFDDAIGRGAVEHDFVKNPAPGAWGVQTFKEGAFDIPYRCLLPREVDGLVMGAGRSVSAANPWLLRAMAMTMVVGQGAGAGAAEAVRQGVQPRSVDVEQVQAQLGLQGVDLG